MIHMPLLASTGGNLSTGLIVVLVVFLVLLLGLGAAAYLYVQKLKANHANALSEKDSQIRSLRTALDEAKRNAAPMPLSEEEILHNMEKALTNGEFQFYLQPEVDQFTKEIVGAEALARWIRPGKGVYSPGMFIPTLEKHGLVSRLDRHIFEQVCIFQHNRLKKKLPTVPISVNLSRRDLEDENIMADLNAIMDRYQVPQSLVLLEIAASAFVGDIDWLSSLVTKLREEEFHVGIDNLGKNELSLDILKDIPTDSLKLDIKSIGADEQDPRSRQLVSSVLRMGHTSSKNILVGNVETKEQASHLMYIGFRNAQGYLYHKPMPTADFEALIAPKSAVR